MNIKLTKKQEEGIKIAVDRYNHHEKYTVIAGYAGVGKSVTAKYIAEALPHINPDEDVCYAAYTGKSVQVLARRGNSNVSTLHKLLYSARIMPNGRYRFFPVKSIPYKVIIVDEVSMIPKKIIDELLKHDVYVIFLGDPFQLPSFADDKEEKQDLLSHPHIFLDEIMRQEAESEIIRFSMAIRQRKFKTFKAASEEVKIFNKNDMSLGMLNWADQVICSTNKTRISLNEIIRENMYGEKNCLPRMGDKVICTHNEWDTLSEKERLPLINGTIGTVQSLYATNQPVPIEVADGSRLIQYYNMDIQTEDGDFFRDLYTDKRLLVSEQPSLNPQQTYQFKTSKK